MMDENPRVIERKKKAVLNAGRVKWQREKNEEGRERMGLVTGKF